ncbi:hypothetical protein [Catellatospora sp. TT07R-123]|uniref:hypothetical protein n=1 Tax=Catellatospora sp. TT07R-123 TaxID=2733863 RepID=UPI001BB384DE|nr:hypothetical protein [Catellatospora sp. TT07R-123]
MPYNTVDLLDHGMEDAELAGNMPISVDLRTGECDFISWNAVWLYRSMGFVV